MPTCLGQQPINEQIFRLLASQLVDRNGTSAFYVLIFAFWLSIGLFLLRRPVAVHGGDGSILVQSV